MRQRLKSSLTPLSLALFLSVSLLYIRGFLVQDKVYLSFRDYVCVLGSFPHHLNLLIISESTTRTLRVSWVTDPNPIPPRISYFEVGAQFPGGAMSIWLPHWLSLLIFSILPLHWLLNHGARRAKKLGLCPVCGYDLRATPQRCPECGTVVASRLVTNS